MDEKLLNKIKQVLIEFFDNRVNLCGNDYFLTIELLLKVLELELISKSQR